MKIIAFLTSVFSYGLAGLILDTLYINSGLSTVLITLALFGFFMASGTGMMIMAFKDENKEK